MAIARSDKDYYKHLGAAIKKMDDLLKIPPEKVKKFIIEHMIDVLPYEDKKRVLNYVTANETLSENSIAYKIKVYFDKFVIKDKYLTCIVFYDQSKRHILIYDKRRSEWKDAEAEDERDLSKAITDKYTVNTGRFSKYLGLISNSLFKVKDSTNKRSHGSTCQQTTKSKNIEILNNLLGAEIINKDNIKPLADVGVCCVQEMLMRYYNESRNDKIWFVNADTAKMYNL